MQLSFHFSSLFSAGPSRKAHCRLSWQAACLCGRQALSGGRSISYIRYVLICGRFKTYKRRPFSEASLMLTRTRSAGSFCLDCSHRKLHPCLTGDLLLPGPRQSAHLLPVPQISSGGRSLLVSLGAAAGFLPVRPAISCLLPSPGWLSPIRQPPSGAWAQIPAFPVS